MLDFSTFGHCHISVWVVEFESKTTRAVLTDICFIPISEFSYQACVFWCVIFPTEFYPNLLRIHWQTALLSFLNMFRCRIPAECWRSTFVSVVALFIALLQISAFWCPWPLIAHFAEQHCITILMVVASLTFIQAITFTFVAHPWFTLVCVLARSAIVQHACECGCITAKCFCALVRELWVGHLCWFVLVIFIHPGVLPTV